MTSKKAELTEIEKIQLARDNGIKRAAIVYHIAIEVGVPFFVACAFLRQESAGGLNIFGSDAGSGFRGVDLIDVLGDRQVTMERYKLYKMHRDRLGAQGIGPMQITFPAEQDICDDMGGCWKFEVNVKRGLQLVKGFKDQLGTWHNAAGRYNGSGPDGEYAARNDEFRAFYRDLLNG